MKTKLSKTNYWLIKAVIVIMFFTQIELFQPVKAAEPFELSASSRQGSASTAQFDGKWTVRLTAAEHNYDSGIARGYTFEFDAQVENGILHGERGTEGEPGWLTIDGTIQPDGTAQLRLFGIVGQSEYAIGHINKGSTYGYLVKAHFEGTHGSGNRVGGRPTDFTFYKK